MKRFWIGFMALALALPSLALAANFRAETHIPAGEAVMGNLYLAGGNPTINGNVQGDLYVAGGNIVVTGSIADDLVATGGNISVTGPIGGDVRAFGGTVYIDSSVNGEVLVYGGEVKIGPNAKIQQDLTAGGGTVDLDPQAQIFGTKMLQPGDNFRKDGRKMTDAMGRFAAGAFWVATTFALLSYFIVAALYLSLFPTVLKKFATKGLSKNHFWPALGLGLLLLIATPIVAVLLMVTVVGALLGALLMLVYAAYIIVNVVFAGVLFGELMKKRFAKTKKVEPSWAWGLGGIAALHLVSLVPFVGWLIAFVFFLFSVGTLAMVQWKVARAVK